MYQVIADYDAQGVFVYQAFGPHIVDAALRAGTFAAGFSLDRMTWVKPSFGWMLHRSEYATAARQERIVRVKLPHEFLAAVLERAVPTSFDPRRYATEAEWGAALRRSDVRVQWDPDRDWRGAKLDRRAVQLGLSGETVRGYVAAVIGLEDVTALAHACRDARAARAGAPPAWPAERVWPAGSEG